MYSEITAWKSGSKLNPVPSKSPRTMETVFPSNLEKQKLLAYRRSQTQISKNTITTPQCLSSKLPSWSLEMKEVLKCKKQTGKSIWEFPSKWTNQ